MQIKKRHYSIFLFLSHPSFSAPLSILLHLWPLILPPLPHSPPLPALPQVSIERSFKYQSPGHICSSVYVCVCLFTSLDQFFPVKQEWKHGDHVWEQINLNSRDELTSKSGLSNTTTTTNEFTFTLLNPAFALRQLG